MLIFEILTSAVAEQIAALGICDGKVDVEREDPLPDDKLPGANVFISNDDANPAGAPRTGAPSYEHTTKIVVEIEDKANTGRALKSKLGRQVETVLQSLLTDRRWGDPRPGVTPDGFEGIEGIGDIKQIYQLEPRGAFRIGRVQLIIDVLHRSTWDPSLDAGARDLTRIDVRGPGGLGANITVPTE